MTTQKNGVTIPTNGKKIETTVPVVPIRKIEVNPLDAKIQRITELANLQKQHTRLLLSGQKLEEFKLKKGDENIELTLNDENNRNVEFSTKNPEVIEAVVNFLRSIIQDKKSQAEVKLLTAL